MMEVTEAGLRGMTLAKEWERKYQKRDDMKRIQGARDLEKDMKKQMTYKQGMTLEDDPGGIDHSGTTRKTKKPNITKWKDECWCGAVSHKKRMLKDCPFRGWTMEDVMAEVTRRRNNAGNGELHSASVHTR